MAYESWLPLDETSSYLMEDIRWGDKTLSPFMEIHQRLLRLGEAYKYAPCASEDVETFFQEPLLRWGLTRWGLDSTGGDIESWVPLEEFGMRENFPRTTMCEYAQRAMCAVLTMAREGDLFPGDSTAAPDSTSGTMVEMTIARNPDWTEYTGAGSWDSTGYEYDFTQWSGLNTDWALCDRPETMSELYEWLEKIRAVLDELTHFALPFHDIRLSQSDPPYTIDLDDTTSGEINYNIGWTFSRAPGLAKSVRSRDEDEVVLDEHQTQDPDGWNHWSPAHGGRGETYLADDLEWENNSAFRFDATGTLEDGSWNWASAGTHQTWYDTTTVVETDQVQIIDVHYTPYDTTGGEMAPTWTTAQLRGDKFYHYGDATSNPPFTYDVDVDSHIGDVVNESDLTLDTYTKTWAEQDLGQTYQWIKDFHFYRWGESFGTWFAKNWIFFDISDSNFTRTWTSGFLVGVGFYYRLELDFSSWWTGQFGTTKPWGNYHIQYTLRSMDGVNWTWAEQHSRDMATFGFIPFTISSYNTSSARILRDRRAPGTNLIPVYVAVEPPAVDVYRYSGNHLQDGHRLGEVIHTAYPSSSFTVHSAEIAGAGTLDIIRAQKIAGLNCDLDTDLDSSDKTELSNKNAGKLGLNLALLGESRFNTLDSTQLYYLMEEGTQLDRISIADLSLGENLNVKLSRDVKEVPQNYFLNLVDAFSAVVHSEVLESYDANHHYHEFDSGSTEPHRVSVLPQLAYRPADDEPLYRIYAYVEVFQTV